jgi:hypothetical protein
MSKDNPIEAPEIPPHMLEDPRGRAQKKAFAKAKKAAPAKKTAKTATKSTGGYGSGAGKEEKP